MGVGLSWAMVGAKKVWLEYAKKWLTRAGVAHTHFRCDSSAPASHIKYVMTTYAILQFCRVAFEDPLVSDTLGKQWFFF